MKRLTLALLLALSGCHSAPAFAGRDGLPPRAPAPVEKPKRHAVKTVLASFYGRGERLNRHTSTGEVFRPLGMTAAHRTLPFGTRLLVALGDRSVVVRVNDRGPDVRLGRDLDLSFGAAKVLGMTRQGVARVRVSILGENNGARKIMP